MSKQIVMGVTMEELTAVGIDRYGAEWAFYLIEDMKIDAYTDCVENMKVWESEGAENIGNDLSRLTKKKEGGYIELDVVVDDGRYFVKGVCIEGKFLDNCLVLLTSCPNIVGFGGILFEGCSVYSGGVLWGVEGQYCDILSHKGEHYNSDPRKPIKARFWREG